MTWSGEDTPESVVPREGDFRVEGPPLRRWGWGLVPEPWTLWAMVLGIGAFMLATGSLWGLGLLALVILMWVPPYLTLGYRARLVALDGDALTWRPYLGRVRTFRLGDVVAIEAVEPPRQVRFVPRTGRPLVICGPLPDAVAVADRIVRAAPQASLLDLPSGSLAHLRYYWSAWPPADSLRAVPPWFIRGRSHGPPERRRPGRMTGPRE